MKLVIFLYGRQMTFWTGYFVLLEKSATDGAVVSNARGFPPSVVTTWIRLVELEAMVLVPANVQDRHAKRTLP